MRHFIKQGDGSSDITAFGVHVEEVVGDEGGGDAAGGDEMGMELFAIAEIGGESVGFDELS